MKQIFILFTVSFLSVLSSTKAQYTIEENFSYPTGYLLEVSGGNWTVPQTGTYPVQVINGNLSYPGYPSSEIGNYIFLDGGTSGRMHIKRIFGETLPTFYLSLLIKFQDTLDLSDYYSGTNYFLTLSNQSTSYRGYVYVKKSYTPGKVVFGLLKISGYPVIYDTNDVSITDPILLVIKYKAITGSNNDIVSLWINPPLTEDEPAADITSSTGSDFDGGAGIYLRQYIGTGNFYIDGIRVSSTWGNAPLPVQLTTFTASVKEKGILLTWKTETEIDNYGFEVERKITSDYRNEEWKKIAFLQGHGNCNAPKYYSITDPEVYNYCSYLYRLKQVNTDGSFTYSDEVSLSVDLPAEFNLYQNYPNPFNPSTRLRFSLPGESQLNIYLYNILGELKKTIFNGLLPAGDHEMILDAGELSSGTYFCILKSGEMHKSIKIILVR